MNLGTIGKRIRKIGRDTAAEVQKMNDIRQINSKINEQKKQISSIYTQIGQKLYKLYREAPLEGFDMEFQRIEERMETIEVYNDQIREIRGVRICPNCHTEISLTERYCSACGQKLPEIVYVQEDENGNMVIENSGNGFANLEEKEAGESEPEEVVEKAEAGEIIEEVSEEAEAGEGSEETEAGEIAEEASEEAEAGEIAGEVSEEAEAGEGSEETEAGEIAGEGLEEAKPEEEAAGSEEPAEKATEGFVPEEAAQETAEESGLEEAAALKKSPEEA